MAVSHDEVGEKGGADAGGVDLGSSQWKLS
jgi:hypothetical protein